MTSRISRRHFGCGLAAGAAALAMPVAGAHAEALSASATPGILRSDRKKTATDVIFTAYALPTQWHPIKQIGSWPLDHTSLITSTGMEWGCFGRKYTEDPSVATAIAVGPGDELWARAIAGPDGSAGIDFGVTGVCDQVANRILVPTGLTVKNSPGNEIAILLSGIYGQKLKDFVVRVKDAAAAVNTEHPGRISEAMVASAVETLGGGLKSEWDLVRANNERIIKPVLGAQYDAIAPDIEYVYLSFYYHREALIHTWERGMIGKQALVVKVTTAFVQALNDLRDVVGPQNYKKIIPVPPQEASDYVFYQERA